MNDAATEQLRVENALHHALKNQEFVLHYQPMIDLRTGRIVSMEALVRWQAKNGELIAPNQFIPIVESTGLINELGVWIFRTACAQVKAWHEQGLHDIKMSINISPVQLRTPELSNIVLRILDEMELAPEALDFEITETVLIQNISLALDQLERLQKRGIGLSIDDFGTGYSSLSYLKRLPVDTVKIDRSFIKEVHRGSHDFSILRAITAMAHELGISILAEGVETEEQLDIVMELGTDLTQGYLFSKPLPAAEATDLLHLDVTAHIDHRFRHNPHSGVAAK